MHTGTSAAAPGTAVKEALLGAAREQLPSSLLHLWSSCLWNFQADKQGWKALMINSGKEREIPAHGLTWQPSAGAAAMGLVLLFGKVLLFFLSV